MEPGRVTLELLAETPKPVWLLAFPKSIPEHDLVHKRAPIFKYLGELYSNCVFRGVNASRLSVILRSGIDVEPTDSAFFAGDLDKALEYGGWPKIVLALNAANVQRSFRVIQVADGPDVLANLARVYGTVLRDVDGKTIWLSRFPEADRRAGTAYEESYGRWIEGNAMEALRAVLLLMRPQDTIDGSTSVRNDA